MSKVGKQIIAGLEEAVTMTEIMELFKGTKIDRLRAIAEAERDGRVVIIPECEKCRFNEKGERCDRCFFEEECIGRSCYDSFAPIEEETAVGMRQAASILRKAALAAGKE